ncbi:unnamed protein product [Parascedosporium putredinis]|uniref:Thioredoxin-like fold domain-containing protein n=1 Tax=Parascedosporium putredinis TaxID=1442378 RepID=A0A9P1MBB9_9PEZI|nr:unnamed protein product [Parascedosporium putredinis]CAI7995641.1 unnamed protein product [Parascedosporium putredinis]
MSERSYIPFVLPNELPARCAVAAEQLPVLFVFASDEAARAGAPSHNPACLKWQTYLKMAAIDFLLHPSNNHASPPAPSLSSSPLSDRHPFLQTLHLRRHQRPTPAVPARAETYLSLLDSALRPAYLHALYLDPRNDPLLTSLYLDPNLPGPSPPPSPPPSAPPPRKRSSPPPDAPTLFDAAVFAYTNMLLDESLAWGDPRLPNSVREFDALVRHRERILAKYWPGLIRD